MPWRRAAALAGLAVLVAGPAWSAELELPSPAAARAQEASVLCPVVGCFPDRLQRSVVPGAVTNTERVLVELDGGGVPSRVQVEQRLVLAGVGDYVIRERGPARAARPLTADEDPPVTKFGAVVWQGFTPGDRRLGALLTLDPELERPRLPARVAVRFKPVGGAEAVPLAPGGAVPSAGTVLVRIENRTVQAIDLPTALEAPAVELAGPLDAALAAARAGDAARLPSTAAGLPARVAVTGPRQVRGATGVPLRVNGSLRFAGAASAASGPGTTPAGDVSGTLAAGAVDVAMRVEGPGVLQMSLDVVPVLDERQLQPPAGAATWAAWARSNPPAAARRAALDLLVQVAATGARAASYSPYLGADLPGTGSTTYRYSLAVPDSERTAPAPLTPRRGPIALVSLAALLVLVNAVLLHRQL